jgi:hypothetical protein
VVDTDDNVAGETDEQRYQKFKLKVKQQVEEAKKVSESEEETEAALEMTADANRDEDFKLFKKSQKA